MGIKLEYIITVLFVAIVFFAMTVKLTSHATIESQNMKEMEFFNTTFIEVDTEKKQAQLYTPYGVRKEGVLVLETIDYFTPTIESLLSDKGTYRENVLYLDGNVRLKEPDGNIYESEHAQYDQKGEILRITSPFVAYMGKNVFRGQTLVYNAKLKEANATQIDAIVYPAKK